MFRAASRDDLVALRDLERAANLAALGHVFPPERYPFPDDDVLARWALLFEDPDVGIEWPLPREELLFSERDRDAPRLKDIEPPF